MSGEFTQREAVGLGGEHTSEVDPEALIGLTLASRYQIEAQIGKGGMGVVYLASQRTLNRKVVVKVLGRGMTGDGEASQRFEREALGLSQLQHPNIVTIYDFGHEHDLGYIVMEYVEGETLSDLMRRLGPLPFEVFGPIAAQILGALAEAHSRGIIHRDIKPSNIMLCERHGTPNFVKVLDFGLAKLVDDAAEVTKKQSLVGSVAFLAPEQILGLEFDQRCDVYALGVLFYYMLSGQKPFVGEDDIAVLYQHIHKEPRFLWELLPTDHDHPDGLFDLVHACLSKDPNMRPRDAREVLARLQSEGSRAMIQLPWSTGEFAAISRESVTGSLKRPTGELQAVSSEQLAAAPRKHLPTPSSQLTIPQLMRDSSPEYTPTPGSQPSLATPHGAPDAPSASPQRPSRAPLLALSAIALVLIVGLIVALSQNTPRPAVVEIGAERARLEQSLSEIDALTTNERFGQAESMLAALRPELAEHPDLLRQAAERDDQITIGKLLQQAALSERAGELDEARKHYRAALARNPNHAQALAALDALNARQPKEEAPISAALAKLSIQSPVKAAVFLDGKRVGDTPFEGEAPAGAHTIELRASGYEPWTAQVTLTPSSPQHLSPSLVKSTSKKGRPTSQPTAQDTSNPPKDSKKPANELLIPVEKPREDKLKTHNDLLPVGP